jgi:hypothetical protein
MRKALADPEFHKEYTKIVGEEPNPLMPQEFNERDQKHTQGRRGCRIIKKLSGSGPFAAAIAAAFKMFKSFHRRAPFETLIERQQA